MLRIAFFLLIVPLVGSAQTSSIRLSANAEISVITCGPGQEELYSAFGHSAFRVLDPDQSIDYAYNYGVFDFNQPNFYLNFTRGYLYYKLGIAYYQPWINNGYIEENRYVHEQVLNLNTIQKQKLFDYLEWNSLPENESYRYDYFYNNCATKIRDVVKEVFKDDVQFDGSYIKTHYTIRDLTDIYLVHQPWGDLGIDICLGLPMDKKATPYEYMFLPDYIESAHDNATVKQNGVAVPLVKQKIIVHEPQDVPISKSLHPIVVFSAFALIAIAITLYDLKRHKITLWFDTILFGILGSFGCLFLFLWFGTDHQAAAKNFNLLWALPTHVIAIIAFVKNPGWLKKYFLGVGLLSIALLALWPVLPQQLNLALIPIVIAIIFRSFAQYKLRRI